MSRCLITGCRLVIPAENKSLWGDLFECSGGDIFVFCGNVDSGRMPQWDAFTCDPGNKGELQIIIDTDDYTERRGIVTVDSKGAHLNDAAKSYVCE